MPDTNPTMTYNDQTYPLSPEAVAALVNLEARRQRGERHAAIMLVLRDGVLDVSPPGKVGDAVVTVTTD